GVGCPRGIPAPTAEQIPFSGRGRQFNLPAALKGSVRERNRTAVLRRRFYFQIKKNSFLFRFASDEAPQCQYECCFSHNRRVSFIISLRPTCTQGNTPAVFLQKKPIRPVPEMTGIIIETNI